MPVNERWLKFAFWSAGANWLKWRADFEFEGNADQLPVLQHQDRYRAFIKDYSLLRYYTGDEREALRTRLSHPPSFQTAVDQPNGQGIDALAQGLREEFPAFDTERSFLSKLAAFARPETFVAWDRFARKGVARQNSGPANGNYQSYADYLRAVRQVLSAELGREIRQFVEQAPCIPAEQECFVLRVLDVYLMILGGRWSTELSTP
jgi:hypothetical protein